MNGKKALAGQFENIEFATRDPGSTALSPQTRQALAKMDQKIAALEQCQHNIRRPLRLRRSDYKKIKALRQQRDLLEKVGYGAYKTQRMVRAVGRNFGKLSWAINFYNTCSHGLTQMRRGLI